MFSPLFLGVEGLFLGVISGVLGFLIILFAQALTNVGICVENGFFGGKGLFCLF